MKRLHDFLSRQTVKALNNQNGAAGNIARFHGSQEITKPPLLPMFALVGRPSQVVEPLDQFQILSFAIPVGKLRLAILRTPGRLLDIRKPEVRHRPPFRAFNLRRQSQSLPTKFRRSNTRLSPWTFLFFFRS